MVCWAPGGFMSTVKHSVVGMRGYGHGCAMAGGEKLSAATASVLEEEIGPGKRGNSTGAHSGCSGGLGELGEAPERAEHRGGSPAAEVGNGGTGKASGRPALRSSARRSRTTRRSLWNWRRGEGGLVAAAIANGGDGRSRVRARERTEEEMGTRE